MRAAQILKSESCYLATGKRYYGLNIFVDPMIEQGGPGNCAFCALTCQYEPCTQNTARHSCVDSWRSLPFTITPITPWEHL